MIVLQAHWLNLLNDVLSHNVVLLLDFVLLALVLTQFLESWLLLEFEDFFEDQISNKSFGCEFKCSEHFLQFIFQLLNKLTDKFTKQLSYFCSLLVVLHQTLQFVLVLHSDSKRFSSLQTDRKDVVENRTVLQDHFSDQLHGSLAIT